MPRARQPVDGPEARPQRRSHQGQPGGCADHGEARQLQANGTGGGTLANDDIEGIVFHGRVEYLFDGFTKAVNFIDEKDGRTGGDLDVDAHLVGHHVRQCGLAQAGRPVKEHMVERLAALAGSRDQDAEVFLDIFLTDQISERLRTQGLVEAVVRFRLRVE